MSRAFIACPLPPDVPSWSHLVCETLYRRKLTATMLANELGMSAGGISMISRWKAGRIVPGYAYQERLLASYAHIEAMRRPMKATTAMLAITSVLPGEITLERRDGLVFACHVSGSEGVGRTAVLAVGALQRALRR